MISTPQSCPPLAASRSAWRTTTISFPQLTSAAMTGADLHSGFRFGSNVNRLAWKCARRLRLADRDPSPLAEMERAAEFSGGPASGAHGPPARSCRGDNVFTGFCGKRSPNVGRNSARRLQVRDKEVRMTRGEDDRGLPPDSPRAGAPTRRLLGVRERLPQVRWRSKRRRGALACFS